MKIEIKYEFGQSMYLKNDIEQQEYLINRFYLGPKQSLFFELMSSTGELLEIAELMCSTEQNKLKMLGAEHKD